MSRTLELPKLSDTMTAATVVKWLKSVGDSITKGEPYAEVETDKATTPLICPVSGNLLEILAPEGTEVPVGGLIAKISSAESSPPSEKETDGPESHDDQGDAETNPAEIPDSKDTTGTLADEAKEEETAPLKPERPGSEKGGAADEIIGVTGDDAGLGEEKENAFPGQDSIQLEESESMESAPDNIIPIQNEASLETNDDQSDPETGLGEVSESVEFDPPDDVTREEENTPAKPEQNFGFEKESDTGYLTAVGDKEAMIDAGEEDTIPTQDSIPFDQTDAKEDTQENDISGNDLVDEDQINNIDDKVRIIKDHLIDAISEAHLLILEKEIDASNLIRAKESINAHYSKIEPSDNPTKIGISDLVACSVCKAILHVPEINATLENGKPRIHNSVNLSFSVYLANGIANPVIRDASSKHLTSIAVEARELIDKARTERLAPEDEDHPTFAISNLATHGIDRFRVAAQPPVAACLAIASPVEKPIIDDKRQLTIGRTLVLSLTCDHRVVEVSVATSFLKNLGDILENPEIATL